MGPIEVRTYLCIFYHIPPSPPHRQQACDLLPILLLLTRTHNLAGPAPFLPENAHLQVAHDWKADANLLRVRADRGENKAGIKIEAKELLERIVGYKEQFGGEFGIGTRVEFDAAARMLRVLGKMKVEG